MNLIHGWIVVFVNHKQDVFLYEVGTKDNQVLFGKFQWY
jgi:hypothetical protein